jgi:hypothetical protein
VTGNPIALSIPSPGGGVVVWKYLIPLNLAYRTELDPGRWIVPVEAFV